MRYLLKLDLSLSSEFKGKLPLLWFVSVYLLRVICKELTFLIIRFWIPPLEKCHMETGKER